MKRKRVGLNLRMPKAMHLRLKKQAKKRGISLNSEIISILTLPYMQEDLGPQFSKVLYDNLWELYSR